ncbi:hypothetical protein VPH184E373B_0225 [Vibrio phage 184E37-3b]|nr:hypothetical protein MYOV056v2_p0201 [Vibrio phage 184E37.3a]
MTNLEAMQDADLRQMIRDVELLERLLSNLVGYRCPPKGSSSLDWEIYRGKCVRRNTLKNDITRLQELITERWRELVEEGYESTI